MAEDSNAGQEKRTAERMQQIARLWSAAQPLVSAMISSTVINFHDAEDLVAQVAETAVAKFDQYDSSRPFRAWAMGIARNVLLRYFERRAGDIHVYLDPEALSAIGNAHLEIADEAPGRLVALRQCISGLRGKQQRLFEMRYFHDLKPDAIAEALGMSRNAVWVTLHRVRAVLMECVQRRLSTQTGQPQ